MTERFTIVFEGDIRTFDGNPLRTETPFGIPYTVAVGDIVEQFNELQESSHPAPCTREPGAPLPSDETRPAVDKVRTMLAMGINIQGNGAVINGIVTGILEGMLAHVDELEADLKCAIAVGQMAAKQGQQSAAMSEWQPIETAPKDGTYIDIWIGTTRLADVYWGRPEHSCGEYGQYCDSCPTRDDWCDTFGYITGEEGHQHGAVTHWMPIPAGPIARNQGQGGGPRS